MQKRLIIAKSTVVESLVLTNVKPSERRMKSVKDNKNDNKEAVKPENADVLANSNNNSASKTENQLWKYIALTKTEQKFKEIELVFQQSLNSTSNKIIQVSVIQFI